MLGRRVTQFLKEIKAGLIQDVPPEYQACESCREPECNTARSETCKQRLQAEGQERDRRGI
jgi:hypothetical protein